VTKRRREKIIAASEKDFSGGASEKRTKKKAVARRGRDGFRRWSSILNNGAGITSANLDRLLYQAETVVIDDKSYRMKAHLKPPNSTSCS
jgi:hypothetical protein